MSRLAALAATSAGIALSISTLAGATAAHADEMGNCLANGVGANNITCLTYTKMAGTPTNGQVKVTWQILPGSTKTSLNGGIWLTRAPIAGERSGSASDDFPNPTSGDTCSAWADPKFVGCFLTYDGLSGSRVMNFPLSMAGYQYVIHQSESLLDADGTEASHSGIADFTNESVWVHKAYRYKYKGKTYFSRNCPPRARGNCTAVVNLVLNNDVGSGMPVSPTS
ncbi:MAG: hypothetical protein RL205_1556 [Actinomycetota bacterium]